MSIRAPPSLSSYPLPSTPFATNMNPYPSRSDLDENTSSLSADSASDSWVDFERDFATWFEPKLDGAK